MNPVERDTAERYAWGAGCDGWHLVQDAELSVIEERMPPGAAEARHRHRRAQQFFYVLSGRADFELDGQTLALGPGQGVRVPPGAPHQILNPGPDALRFLVISQPPSHGDREPA